MTSDHLRRMLRSLGCVEIRQRGSHLRVQCGKCFTTVPVHKGEDVPRGTLRAIERDSNRAWARGAAKTGMKGDAMAQRKRYTAQFHREDGWWIVRILEAKGVHSNGRTLEEAKRRVREALSLDIGDDAFSVEITDKIKLPTKASRQLAKCRTARKRAQAELGKATAATREAARALKESGLSVRDSGNLLGLTGARVSQLLSERAERRRSG